MTTYAEAVAAHLARRGEATVLEPGDVLAALSAGLVPANVQTTARERAFGAQWGGMVVPWDAPRQSVWTGDGLYFETWWRGAWRQSYDLPRISTHCEAWMHETCEATGGFLHDCRCACHG